MSKWLEFKVEEPCDHRQDIYAGCPLCRITELEAEHTALVDGLRPIATEMIEPECPEDEVDDCETCQCFIDWGNRILAQLGKESEDGSE